MNGLQDSVEARRASRPVELACVVAGTPAPALWLCPWEERSWVMPWSYLTAVSLTENDERDVMEFAYTGYAVTIAGHHLGGIIDDLAGFRLTCLRALPPNYQSRLSAEAPFIWEITVRSIPAARESPS